jgi:TPR repeat protein
MSGNINEERAKALKLYNHGSYDMAQKLFQPLAESGDLESQYYLGETLLLRTYDYDNAVAWWRKAAEQGHAGAQSNLGYMMVSGLGVEQNNDEAIRLFQLAARKGHAEA